MKKTNFNFIRINCATPYIIKGDLNANLATIKTLIQQAEKDGTAILVLPPLVLTGYDCGDIFTQELILSTQEEFLNSLISFTSEMEILIVFSHQTIYKSNLVEMLSFIKNGNLVAGIPTRRTELNNEVFFIDNEDKYLTIFDTHTDITLGFSDDHDIQFILSSSKTLIGKYDYYKKYISSLSAKNKNIIVFCDTNGTKIIAENGVILEESSPFGNMESISCDVDLQIIKHERSVAKVDRRELTFNKYFAIPKLRISDDKMLKRLVPKSPFMPLDSEKYNQCLEIFAIQTQEIASRLISSHAKKSVIGISGGLDSTLALLATAVAHKKIGLSTEDIITITMPGFGTTDRTYENALTMMESLGTTSLEIPIKKAVLSHFEDISHDPKIKDSTYENSQARERTQILMDLSNKYGGIVIGTGDLSEIALGWCTYNGDHMSMFGANAGIPKTVIKEVIRWFIDEFLQNDNFIKDYKTLAHSLKDVVDTPISPELLPTNNDGQLEQKTEDTVGPYELVDFFLYYHIRYGFRPSKIQYLADLAFEGEYDHNFIKKYLIVFYKRFFTQQFKRTTAPEGVQVGSVDLSSKTWKMPSDVSMQMWLNDIY
ncbi:MAG: NAD(+) synthase [Eubacteriales bacterium]|nr:NAD(+) synthase [Eubacteriales bacterium]MDY3332459.1 NAD(+) synthase [Gallibacter sp.]